MKNKTINLNDQIIETLINYIKKNDYIESLRNIKKWNKILPGLVNLHSKEGKTPLITALSYIKDPELMVSALIIKGADVNLCDRDNKHPLDYAEAITDQEVREKIINILKSKDADKNLKKITTANFVSKINDSKYIEIIKESLSPEQSKLDKDLIDICKNFNSLEYNNEMIKLLKNGANPNVTDIDHNTPLHHIAHFNFPEGTKALLEYKADINECNNYGRTPLHIAAELGILKNVLCLLTNGANPNIQDNNNNTPLHIAIHKNNINTIRHLIIQKANLSIKNTNGDTPLDCIKIQIKNLSAKLTNFKNTSLDINIYGSSQYKLLLQFEKILHIIEKHTSLLWKIRAFNKYLLNKSDQQGGIISKPEKLKGISDPSYSEQERIASCLNEPVFIAKLNRYKEKRKIEQGNRL